MRTRVPRCEGVAELLVAAYISCWLRPIKAYLFLVPLGLWLRGSTSLDHMGYLNSPPVTDWLFQLLLVLAWLDGITRLGSNPPREWPQINPPLPRDPVKSPYPTRPHNLKNNLPDSERDLELHRFFSPPPTYNHYNYRYHNPTVTTLVHRQRRLHLGRSSRSFFRVTGLVLATHLGHHPRPRSSIVGLRNPLSWRVSISP